MRFQQKKIKLENTIEKNRKRPYVELIFTNFYIDPKKEKAFILVKENNINEERNGGKTDVYFFERRKNKWAYIKKQILVTN